MTPKQANNGSGGMAYTRLTHCAAITLQTRETGS
jgi:hypothetical protein